MNFFTRIVLTTTLILSSLESVGRASPEDPSQGQTTVESTIYLSNGVRILAVALPNLKTQYQICEPQCHSYGNPEGYTKEQFAHRYKALIRRTWWTSGTSIVSVAALVVVGFYGGMYMLAAGTMWGAGSLLGFFGSHITISLVGGAALGGGVGIFINHYIRPINPTTNYHAAKDLQITEQMVVNSRDIYYTGPAKTFLKDFKYALDGMK